MKTALITGITGQNDCQLAEWRPEERCNVYGVVRRSGTENFEHIARLTGRVQLHQADLLDRFSLPAPRGFDAGVPAGTIILFEIWIQNYCSEMPPSVSKQRDEE